MATIWWRGSLDSREDGKDVTDQWPLPTALYFREGDETEGSENNLTTNVSRSNPLPTTDQDVLDVSRFPFRWACQVTITCAAAGDYAAGDVLSQNATNLAGVATYCPNLARQAGKVATIAAIRATSSNASLLSRLRLHFFIRAPNPPEVEMDDNAVFSFITLAGRAIWSGSVLTTAFTAQARMDTPTLQEPLKTAPNDTGLFLVLTTEDAETNESAGQTITMDIYTL